MPVIVGGSASVTWSPGGTGAAALAVTRPDGTPLEPAPTVTGTSGTYSAPIAASQPGRYLLTWTRGTDLFVDILDVWPADPRYLVSIADATSAIGTLPSSSGIDVALLVATATWVIESIRGGSVLPAQKVYRPRIGSLWTVLPDAPVRNVSVALNGVTVDPASLLVDEDAGTIDQLPYALIPGSVVVTYTAGPLELPPPLRTAALELVVHLWRSGRQTGQAGAVAAAADTVGTPFGFAVPRRVVELCRSVPNFTGGFA